MAKIDGNLNRRGLFGLAGTAVVGLIPASATGAPAKRRRFEVAMSDAEWRRRLGAERYAVLRQGATERAWSSPLDKEKRRGTFTCAGCGLPLFASSAKFDSGTGWPSFFRPLGNAVVTATDSTFGMKRTEVLCRRCGGHLGHLFRDGPRPTGLRYCMNGLALRFRPA